MTLLDDLKDEGLPATGLDEKGRPIYSRALTQGERAISNALRIAYMSDEQKQAALQARPDLADRLTSLKLDLPNRRDLRDKYQDTMSDLDAIINAESMTPAQAIQAIKVLARVAKFTLRIIARQYRAERDD